MKFSEQWLREWVNPALSIQEIADQLTMAGIEVESIMPSSEEFSKVVVGEIIKAEQHPNADRLRVCEVNIGNNENLNIVCGAKNARAGIKVATALVGAKLPNGLEIKAAKLRGVESYGMLCSETELGLPKANEGIIELPLDAPVGMDLRKYLQLDDNIIEVNLTPNRGDCLSIAGIAREVATINNCKGTMLRVSTTHLAPTIPDVFPINITAEAACPHYVGRVIRNIKLDAISPVWLKERLRKSGIKTISPVVDATNYVMLELGQPMHAFDLNQLQQQINVRYAKNNEELILLDEQKITLNDKMVVIADEQKPLALAGVMGGIGSSINANTKDLFLESAFFTPFVVTAASRHFNLHTESSHRFERGVDPNLQIKAMQRLTALLLEIVGGEPGPIIEAVYNEYFPKIQPIKLRNNRIKNLLGIEIPNSEIEKILSSLGIKNASEKDENTWQVIPPSYRFDINLEVDLIEELARIYGYQKIPTILPKAELNIKTNNNNKGAKTAPLQIRTSLINAGYHETLTYSFVAANLQNLLDPEQPPIALKNPVSEDLAVMRTNLWPGLLTAYLYNINRQQTRIRLFEIGNCFNHYHNELQQNLCVGGLVAGELYPEQWGITKKSVDFFDVKHDIEMFFSAIGISNEIQYQTATHPALHPGCCAAIYYNNLQLGYLGELHPRLAQTYSITAKIYLFNFNLGAIKNVSTKKFNELSKFPATTRDIAIIVNRELAAQELINEIQSKGGEFLHSVKIFDIYQGEGIEKNQKSVALKLVFQDNERTLVDEEIEQTIKQILITLEKEFKAKLRG